MMGFITAPLGISVALGCGHLSEAVCVALVTYLAYVLFSILATS